VLVVGPNGAGKTNLLESLHVGTQGFSPRTRNDASLIRFGREGARIALAGERAGSRLELNVVLQAGSAKRASLNGARLQTAEQLRGEVATLVFTPDRLVVVKGGPAARRAYFDRALGRGTPTLASLPAEYGAALAQRNAALRGISLGYSTREALRPWTERVAGLGRQLAEARRGVISELEPLFAERAATCTAARRGQARIWTTSRSSQASAISGRSARRASSGSPCWPSCLRRPSSCANAAGSRRSCCSTTCCPSWIPNAGASLLSGYGLMAKR